MKYMEVHYCYQCQHNVGKHCGIGEILESSPGWPVIPDWCPIPDGVSEPEAFNAGWKAGVSHFDPEFQIGGTEMQIEADYDNWKNLLEGDKL